MKFVGMLKEKGERHELLTLILSPEQIAARSDLYFINAISSTTRNIASKGRWSIDMAYKSSAFFSKEKALKTLSKKRTNNRWMPLQKAPGDLHLPEGFCDLECHRKR